MKRNMKVRVYLLGGQTLEFECDDAEFAPGVSYKFKNQTPFVRMQVEHISALQVLDDRREGAAV